MGIDHQRRAEGLWPTFSAAQPTFFFARCATTFAIKIPADLGAQTLDAYTVAILPVQTSIQLYGHSAISDGVYLSAGPGLITTVEKTYQVHCTHFGGGIRILPRTNWLNEVMHRYVYERVVAKQKDNTATQFLEQEIVKEMHYRVEEFAQRDKSRFDLDTHATDLRSPLLRTAMTFVEANLFRDITVEDIAKEVNTSSSTVLREFQTRIGKSPNAYLVDRRLEEAMALIKSQRYSIGQVSDIVGYENLSAFSAAFKKRFGLTPSQVVTKDPADLAKL
jgi:AraC-like DNA-binding protein